MVESKEDDRAGTGAQKRCVACLEFIQPGARICPHCHSHQSAQRWKGIGTFLKWVGAITAVISLVVGVRQLNNIYREWSDRKASIEQFVKAADFQLDLMDYPGAWQIIQDCLAVDAMSPKALKKQVQVAMAWIRDPGRHKEKKKYTEILAPLMPALYRGAVYDDRQLAADALAHIGFANLLRTAESDSKYEIDQYFSQSLQKDPGNTYGHVFWGYWILNRTNTKDYGRDKLEIAKEHFGAARNSAESLKDRDFVNKRALMALGNSYVKGTDVEAVKWINQMRAAASDVESLPRSGINKIFGDMCRTQFDEGEVLPRLLAQMPAQEIRETYLWLSQGESGDRDSERETQDFLLALFAEASGDLTGAFREYASLAQKVKGTASVFRYYVLGALNRVIDRSSKGSATKDGSGIALEEETIVFGDQARFGIDVNSSGLVTKVTEGPAENAGMEKGDIILRIDGQRFGEPGRSVGDNLSRMRDAMVSGERERAMMITLKGDRVILYTIKK